MADIKFEIKQSIGVLSQGSKGWQKEVNLISWNDRKPKLDIREWGPEHERMGKGVTLNLEEARSLLGFLMKADLDNLGID
ncbi:MAG: YdbC family protein [Deltaproteobacteria bacterium]